MSGSKNVSLVNSVKSNMRSGKVDLASEFLKFKNRALKEPSNEIIKNDTADSVFKTDMKPLSCPYDKKASVFIPTIEGLKARSRKSFIASHNSSEAAKSPNSQYLQTKLNSFEFSEVKRLTANGTKDFYKAYDYLGRTLKGRVDDRTISWFQNATQINKGSDNLVSQFVRGYTKIGILYDGYDKSQINMEGRTLVIGQSVISDILSRQGVPEFSRLLSNDIEPAITRKVRGASQTLAGWAGALYYWETVLPDTGKMLGQTIEEDPKELEKFLTMNAAAFYQVIGKQFAKDISQAEFSDVLSNVGLLGGTFGGAPLPLKYKKEIADRIWSVLQSGDIRKAAGDPNNIQGFEYMSGSWNVALESKGRPFHFFGYTEIPQSFSKFYKDLNVQRKLYLESRKRMGSVLEGLGE